MNKKKHHLKRINGVLKRGFYIVAQPFTVCQTSLYGDYKSSK